MSKMYYGSIDVTKIDKSKLHQGEKGKYLNIVIWVNDEPDQYGNKVSVQQGQTIDERQSGVPKVFLGNLKEAQSSAPANQMEVSGTVDNNDGDLPFQKIIKNVFLYSWS